MKFFLSQDDKVRVPLGITAANEQSPILMHVEYRVSLPDHDWVVAARHKLIPSVYAAIKIDENGIGNPKAVGYSGPTFIAIRSGKHSSSTAYSHCLDMDTLVGLPEFETFIKYANKIKPIFILNVDGGPDENPRYQKVIDVAIHHFIHYNLDAIFIATNAPGRSAFNRVERRMAPLSKQLSGVILPHEKYGSHLDNQGRTVDTDLELKNFEFAANTLVDIWNETVIDGYSTVCKYVQKDVSEIDASSLITKNQEWFAEHVRTSQYCVQIVKCFNRDCCSEPRSSIFNILNARFLPPPVPLSQTSNGLKVLDARDEPNYNFAPLFITKSLTLGNMVQNKNKFEIYPYDMFCNTVQPELQKRICNVCQIYFASHIMLKKHMSVHNLQKENQLKFEKIRPIRIAAKRQREMMAI